MRIQAKFAAAIAALALGVVPAVALAEHGRSGSAPGHTKTTSSTTTTTTTPTFPPGNALGRRCQGESKKHEKGVQGTAFSKCVKALEKLAKGTVKNPHTACATESKKHEKGKSGTPYSRCVEAAAKQRAEERSKSSDSDEGSATHKD